MKTEWKKLLPYAGVPLLGAALWLVKGGELNALLLLRELMLIFGYVAAWIDFKEKRVPNRLVLVMLVAWVLVLVPYLFLRTETAVSLLVSSAAGFVLSGVIFLLVYLASRKGLGGGDVKFMSVSGLYLGFGGVLPALLIGSILAAVTAIILIFSKKLSSKGSIPLVPFLYIGILLTLFFR